jgi:hypothetical protein
MRANLPELQINLTIYRDFRAGDIIASEVQQSCF